MLVGGYVQTAAAPPEPHEPEQPVGQKSTPRPKQTVFSERSGRMEAQGFVPTDFTDQHRANLSNRQVLGGQQARPMTLVYEEECQANHVDAPH